jgi:hypothetical protein
MVLPKVEIVDKEFELVMDVNVKGIVRLLRLHVATFLQLNIPTPLLFFDAGTVFMNKYFFPLILRNKVSLPTYFPLQN